MFNMSSEGQRKASSYLVYENGGNQTKASGKFKMVKYRSNKREWNDTRIL